MITWRLIIDGPADGAYNMAVDRAVLRARDAGCAPPTLRLYAWERPTVSLGRFQPLRDVDMAECAALGLGLCRRPTGGRGVLHDDEVTYSVVAGVEDGLPRGVAASYKVICGALVEAYRALGVPADLTARPRGDAAAGACYLHATNADLSLGAAKLSGSAQVWHHATCLQHGSFVLTRDLEAEARVFRLDGRAQAALATRTKTIADVLGSRPSDEAVRSAIISAFERVMGVSLVAGVLSAAEARTAEESRSEHAVECVARGNTHP